MMVYKVEESEFYTGRFYTSCVARTKRAAVRWIKREYPSAKLKRPGRVGFSLWYEDEKAQLIIAVSSTAIEVL